MICKTKFMRRLVGAVVVLLACGATASPASATGKRNEPVLILHDSSGSFGWIGGLHARMLANLIGHFDLRYEIAPVETYTAGRIGKAHAVFYLGTTYDSPLPEAFLRDVSKSTKPVCWLKYNLWQIAGNSSPGFAERQGFRFDYLDQAGREGVSYRGETFSKDQSDPELGRTTILDPTVASAVAWACGVGTANCLPYIVRGGNFWYVADSPFSFISEEDRYLIFTDVLHDILGINHADDHRAVIRIEDVSPVTSPDQLRAVADCLAAEQVPFVVSVIPVYTDPLGAANHGQPRTVSLSKTPGVQEALDYMIAKGGQIVLHGYTHQYDTVPNPYNGVSGDDYEFFRVTLDGAGNLDEFRPLAEDSRKWAHARVTSGLRELSQSGFKAAGWVTPHYAASALDYEVFGARFPLTIQRALYFDNTGSVSGKPRQPTVRSSESSDDLHLAGQFFPYIIHNDIYGQKIVPENLGNVDPTLVNDSPARSASDMIRIARKNKVVRDGWASGFYHPFLGIEALRELVRGVKAEGYTYVPLTRNMK